MTDAPQKTARLTTAGDPLPVPVGPNVRGLYAFVSESTMTDPKSGADFYGIQFSTSPALIVPGAMQWKLAGPVACIFSVDGTAPSGALPLVQLSRPVDGGNYATVVQMAPSPIHTADFDTWLNRVTGPSGPYPGPSSVLGLVIPTGAPDTDNQDLTPLQAFDIESSAGTVVTNVALTDTAVISAIQQGQSTPFTISSDTSASGPTQIGQLPPVIQVAVKLDLSLPSGSQVGFTLVQGQSGDWGSPSTQPGDFVVPPGKGALIEFTIDPQSPDPFTFDWVRFNEGTDPSNPGLIASQFEVLANDTKYLLVEDNAPQGYYSYTIQLTDSNGGTITSDPRVRNRPSINS